MYAWIIPATLIGHSHFQLILLSFSRFHLMRHHTHHNLITTTVWQYSARLASPLPTEWATFVSPFNAILLPPMPKYHLLQELIFDGSILNPLGFSLYGLCHWLFWYSLAIPVSFSKILFHTFIHLHMNRGFLVCQAGEGQYRRYQNTQGIKIAVLGWNLPLLLPFSCSVMSNSLQLHGL